MRVEDPTESGQAVQFDRSPAPPGFAFAHLKPRDRLGAFFLTLAAVLTGVALLLSASERIFFWLPDLDPAASGCPRTAPHV